MLSDIQQMVSRNVGNDDAAVAVEQLDEAIGVALLRYSSDVPRQLVRDVGWLLAGYLAPLPEDWTDSSAIVSAEYPIGQQPPEGLHLTVYMDAGGALLMADRALPAGAQARVTFTVPHALNDTEDTIPAVHREAVAAYTAHLVCRQLATRYSGERESAVAADGSNTDSRARNYASRAREYRAVYYAGIGKPDPVVLAGSSGAGTGAQPAVGVTSWPARRRNGLVSRDVL